MCESAKNVNGRSKTSRPWHSGVFGHSERSDGSRGQFRLNLMTANKPELLLSANIPPGSPCGNKKICG